MTIIGCFGLRIIVCFMDSERFTSFLEQNPTQNVIRLSAGNRVEELFGIILIAKYALSNSSFFKYWVCYLPYFYHVISPLLVSKVHLYCNLSKMIPIILDLNAPVCSLPVAERTEKRFMNAIRNRRFRKFWLKTIPQLSAPSEGI